MRKSKNTGRGYTRSDKPGSGQAKRTGGKPSGRRVGKSRLTEKEAPKAEAEEKKPMRKFTGGKKPVAPKTKAPKNKTLSAEGMRLNRFVANAGVCSRREADTYITAGLVTINGEQVSELGVRVMPGDEVCFDGRKIDAEKKMYLLLNKPKNFVTTTDDPHADRIVMELIEGACEERIYPVGRLDRNTTGLLLFTNDGDLSEKLTHPSSKMKKVYQVTTDKPVEKRHIELIAEGIQLEDGPIAADAISYIDRGEKTEVGIEIHSGKNRIVRRIFEHFGYRVKKLDRVLFAGLTKKNLPRGKYRFLSEKEVKFLKMMR